MIRRVTGWGLVGAAALGLAGSAGGAGMATSDLVPVMVSEEAPPPSGPMIERTVPKPHLKPTPNAVPIVQWAEEEEVGLRRLAMVDDTNPALAARAQGRDNTNLLDVICARQTCRPGARRGETIIDYGHGVTETHTYDQSKPMGFRNTFVSRDADGTTRVTTSSPLVFDLKGQGVRASDRKVRFDIDGDGFKEVIYDFASSNGVLVFDANRDGVSGGNGRELLGENTDLDGDGRRDGYKDGFEALLGLVRKGVREKVLPARPLDDEELTAADLKALEKSYGLKMRVGGLEKKAISLAEAGITGIFLSDEPSRLVHDFDGQGNDVLVRDGATFTRKDGSLGDYQDIWFAFAKASGGHLKRLPAGMGR